VDTTFDLVDASNVVIQSGITVVSISAGTASSATATLVLDQPAI
jgi:predicted amino acid racemase